MVDRRPPRRVELPLEDLPEDVVGQGEELLVRRLSSLRGPGLGSILREPIDAQGGRAGRPRNSVGPRSVTLSSERT